MICDREHNHHWRATLAAPRQISSFNADNPLADSCSISTPSPPLRSYHTPSWDMHEAPVKKRIVCAYDFSHNKGQSFSGSSPFRERIVISHCIYPISWIVCQWGEVALAYHSWSACIKRTSLVRYWIQDCDRYPSDEDMLRIRFRMHTVTPWRVRGSAADGSEQWSEQIIFWKIWRLALALLSLGPKKSDYLTTYCGNGDIGNLCVGWTDRE